MRTVAILVLSLILCGCSYAGTDMAAAVNATLTSVAGEQHLPERTVAEQIADAVDATVTALSQAGAQQEPGGPARAESSTTPPATATALPVATDAGAQAGSTTPSTEGPAVLPLEVDQAWKENDLELRITYAELAVLGDVPGIALQFSVGSQEPNPVMLSYNLGSALSAVDNRGRKVDVLCCQEWRDAWVHPSGCSFKVVNQRLDGGASTLLVNGSTFPGGGDPTCVFLAADVANLEVTEVVVTAKGIGAIREAAWRVPVNH